MLTRGGTILKDLLKGKQTMQGQFYRNSIHYLFIDGAYLRAFHSKITKAWFGKETRIDYRQLLSIFENPLKVFYYDCIPDSPLKVEDAAEFEKRRDAKKSELDLLQEISGVHVRLGKLVHKKRHGNQQKGVDVMLAVDMMEHATQRNMQRATLIAGDQDFLPLVKALQRTGLVLQIAADPTSTTKEFAYSADSFGAIGLEKCWIWSESSERSRSPLSIQKRTSTGQAAGTPIGELTPRFRNKTHKVLLSRTTSGPEVTIVDFEGSGDLIIFGQASFERVKLYLQLEYGELKLNTDAPQA